jgi:hypothetical protein
LCDAPGFSLVSLTLMTESAESNRLTLVKPWSNLGHHLKNLANEPYWTPWPSLHTSVVNLWSKTRSNLA